MKLNNSFVAPMMLVSAGCAGLAEPTANDYQQAVYAIGMPDQFDGQVDLAWEYYQQLFFECEGENELCELYYRVTVDSYIMHKLSENIGVKVEQVVVNNLPAGEFKKFSTHIVSENTKWIDGFLSGDRWFNISEYGKWADKAAFLLVQHSEDIKTQERAVILLTKLASNGETDPRNMALLSDRIAIQKGEKQTFGTQGRCEGAGFWLPIGVSETEFEIVDANRESVGLDSIENYSKTMGSKYCLK